MTTVIGVSNGAQGARETLGEIESTGLSIGWNRATLSGPANAALRVILERNGGAANRPFELHHGPLVLLRCQLIGHSQLSFDGSRRQHK